MIGWRFVVGPITAEPVLYAIVDDVGRWYAEKDYIDTGVLEGWLECDNLVFDANNELLWEYKIV